MDPTGFKYFLPEQSIIDQDEVPSLFSLQYTKTAEDFLRVYGWISV